MVLEIDLRYEVKYGSGDIIRKKKDKQSCHSCMRHFALIWSVTLPSIIKIFLTPAELSSENELKYGSEKVISKM